MLSEAARAKRNELRRARRMREIMAGERRLPAHRVNSDEATHGRKVPDDVLREAAERKAALERRTASQIFFGDPPPGYSALDARAKGAT